MEKWLAYRHFDKEIELIDRFEGGNQRLWVYFTDTEKKKWVLFFDFTWDFRYAIEFAFIGRCYNMEKNRARDGFRSVYLVEDSEYIKYFANQAAGTVPTDTLKHFLIFDQIDTGLEILTPDEPVLYPDDKS